MKKPFAVLVLAGLCGCAPTAPRTPAERAGDECLADARAWMLMYGNSYKTAAANLNICREKAGLPPLGP